MSKQSRRRSILRQDCCQSGNCPVCRAKNQRRAVLNARRRDSYRPQPRKLSCLCGTCDTCKRREAMRLVRERERGLRQPTQWEIDCEREAYEISRIHSTLDPNFVFFLSSGRVPTRPRAD